MLSLYVSWNSWICYFAIFLSVKTWVWASFGSWWWEREVWHDAVHGIAKSQTWLNDWTELIHLNEIHCLLNTLNIFLPPWSRPLSFLIHSIKKSHEINWLHIWGTSKFWSIMPAIKWFSVFLPKESLWLDQAQFFSLCLELTSIMKKKKLAIVSLTGEVSSFWNFNSLKWMLVSFKIWLFVIYPFFKLLQHNIDLSSPICCLQVELSLWFRMNFPDY